MPFRITWRLFVKPINRRHFCMTTAGALAAAGAALPGAANAQAGWPSRPITIIVPFAAAGSNDVIARAIANELSQSLKQPVIVENRPGAGSMLGAGLVAKAPADGYTLMLSSSSVTIGIALKTGLSFDGRKDFTPIALAASGPLMVVASNRLAARTPQEFVTLARANPGKLTYGSSGIGSTPHMGMELLNHAANIQLLHVPYKGGAPVLNDIMGGQLDLYFGSFPQVLPLVRAGKIKAIGVTSSQRSPLVPDIPPMADAIPNFSSDLWWGVFGPGNMPPNIVTLLNEEINKALRSPAIRKFAETEGVVTGNLTADQFGKVYQEEIQEWEALGKKLNIKLE
jgi:tripartite-type tricarboxylate transporter receptor subunit TctC